MNKINETLGAVPPVVQLLLAGVGALYVGGKLFNYLQLVLEMFVLSGTNLSKYGKKGTWAVVTGASDGLGKEFAMQLAARGFNVVLVSRTLAKLEALAKDLEQKHAGKGFESRVVAMDYALDRAADYEGLARLVSGLDVGVLINNVGQSHGMPVPFLQTGDEELQSIVTVNCLGTLKTTKAVAPVLARREKSLILTVGSFAGWMPTPYLATYSGSKAFLQHWSSALAAELQPVGVDVHLVLSYFVATALSKIRRTSALVPSPRQWVRAALAKVGLGGSQRMAHTYTPWWSHALFQWLVENTVGAGSRFGIWYTLKMNVDTRRRALKKAEREAKKA